MNVLLLRPPLQFRRGWDINAHAEVPQALISLGAVLEQAGHDVRILDASVQAEPGALAFDENGFLHVGATWDQIEPQVREARPDVVGINNPFYTQMPPALEAARRVRQVLPDTPILLGGPPVTVRPEEYLAEPAVTAAAIGESERSAPRLVEAAAAGRPLDDVPGVAFRRDGRVVQTSRPPYVEDLDTLPPPAYHLIDLKAYLLTASQDADGRWRWQDRPIMPTLTSRGCPYHCSFCTVHALMGRKYRWQSADRVLEHIRFIATDLGIRHLHFIDDNLAQNLRRFHRIIDGLNRMRRDGLPITWETPMGMRTDKLTFDVLKKAQEAGCRSIFLTVESGSQRVLDEVIGKRLRLESVARAAEACHSLGLKARAGFIMGLPGETLDDMQMTVDFARRLKRRYGIRGHLSIATPLYATRLHETCAERGYLRQPMTPDNVARSFTQGGMIETENWSIADLRRMRDAFHRQTGWGRRTLQRLRRRLKGANGQ